jgi:hypothetical protein
MSGAQAAVYAIEYLKNGKMNVKAIQDYFF